MEFKLQSTMRDIYISSIEQKIIDRICDDGTNIATLLTDHIPELLLNIHTEKNVINLLFKKDIKDEGLTKKAIFQTERIIYIIKFVLQLEREGLLTIGYFAHGRVVETTWAKSENYEKYKKNKDDYSKWEFTDHNIREFIFKYADQSILPTPELLAFKNRKYRTKEEKRHNEAIMYAKIGVGVALLIGVLNLCMNISTDSPTKQQIDTII